MVKTQNSDQEGFLRAQDQLSWLLYRNVQVCLLIGGMGREPASADESVRRCTDSQPYTQTSGFIDVLLTHLPPTYKICNGWRNVLEMTENNTSGTLKCLTLTAQTHLV